MDERRRSPRFAVQDVRGTLLLANVARVVNMSLTGMAVETDSRLRPGRAYSLRLQHGETPDVAVQATVMWSHLRQIREGEQVDGRIVYVSGLEFGDILTDRAREVMAFLKEAAVVSVQARLCGRFRARFAQPVQLVAEVEFEVRTLSASGMMVVADVEVEAGSVLELEVQLDGHPFRARARVANVAPAAERGRFAIGLGFAGMGEADREDLLAFIARLIA